MLTDKERLDRIARNEDDPLGRRRSTETLNAIHACREGHPLGRNNPWKWRNAASMVGKRCCGDDYDWLTAKAADEHRRFHDFTPDEYRSEFCAVCGRSCIGHD